MKKYLLTFLISLTAISLFGCGQNESKSLGSLNKHLENTEAIVRNTSSSEIYEVSPATNYDEIDLTNPIQIHRANSYNNMMREENLRQQILSLSAYIKNVPTSKIKLSKNKRENLKQLRKNLDKYTNLLDDTREDVRLSVNTIKRNMVIGKMNMPNVERAYITLNNSMNERYAYLSGIYGNLLFAKDLINESFEQDSTANKESTQTISDEQNTKNIDSYTPDENAKIQPEKAENSGNNVPYPQIYNNYRYNNRFNYGYYNNGYNYGFNRFNPNRNTDTFYPYNRNIDTYRFSPNHYSYYENGIMPLKSLQPKNSLNNPQIDETCPECE